MTSEEIHRILNNISIFDRKFEAIPIVTGDGLGWTIQVTYWEEDVDTGKMELQKSRKWVIEPNATETDVVDTVFAAVMRSYDHVVKEHFTYCGKRIYSPHFHVQDRLKIAP